MNGTAELIILSCLEKHSFSPFEICEMVHELFDEEITIKSESIYSNIYKLQKKGYISSENITAGKKRVKYTLLPKGKEKVMELRQDYDKICSGVNLIINRNKV